MGCQCRNKLFLGRGLSLPFGSGLFPFLLGDQKFHLGSNHLNTVEEQKMTSTIASQIFREPVFGTSSLLCRQSFACPFPQLQSEGGGSDPFLLGLLGGLYETHKALDLVLETWKILSKCSLSLFLLLLVCWSVCA